MTQRRIKVGIKDSRFQTTSHSVASLIFIPAEALVAHVLSVSAIGGKEKKRKKKWSGGRKIKRQKTQVSKGYEETREPGGGAEGTVSGANGIKLCQRAADGEQTQHRVTERASGNSETQREEKPQQRHKYKGNKLRVICAAGLEKSSAPLETVSTQVNQSDRDIIFITMKHWGECWDWSCW